MPVSEAYCLNVIHYFYRNSRKSLISFFSVSKLTTVVCAPHIKASVFCDSCAVFGAETDILDVVHDFYRFGLYFGLAALSVSCLSEIILSPHIKASVFCDSCTVFIANTDILNVVHYLNRFSFYLRLTAFSVAKLPVSVASPCIKTSITGHCRTMQESKTYASDILHYFYGGIGILIHSAFSVAELAFRILAPHIQSVVIFNYSCMTVSKTDGFHIIHDLFREWGIYKQFFCFSRVRLVLSPYIQTSVFGYSGTVLKAKAYFFNIIHYFYRAFSDTVLTVSKLIFKAAAPYVKTAVLFNKSCM